MKMNFKYLMLVGALLAGFTSCNNDDEITDGGLQPNGEMTTARFTLSQAGAVTRAVDAAPTADEKEIKSATLYVFNAKQTLEKIIEFTTLTTSATGGTATSQVVEVTSGGHFFLASVNAPAVTGIVEGTSTVATVERALVDIASMGTITTTNGFFMTSQSVISQNLIPGEDVNEVNIEVGRAMAKVNVACSGGENTTSLSGANGKLVDVMSVTANNPKEMYYFPVIEGGIFKTPYYGESGVDNTRYFPALKYTDSYAAISGQSVDPSVASYLMENSNEVVRKGNSSYLLVSGQYVPSIVRNDDNTADATLPADGTFYRLYNVDNDQYYDVYITATNKASIDPKKFTDDAKAIEPGHPEYKGHTVNVIEYPKGYSYYAFYLENEDNVSPISRYTAKRNVYYDVTLTNVMNAGASVPNIKGNNDEGNTPDDEYIPGTGGGDGGDNNNNATDDGGEIDPLEGVCDIQGTISVKEWNVVTQSGGIGN